MDKKKHFRVGMYTTTMSLAAIALTIIVNLFVSSLPDAKTKIDLTATAMYSIGKQSIQIAQALDHDITIYLLAQNGYEDTTLLEFLNRYCSESNHITIKTKDPVLYPNFAAQYTTETPEENSLIVVDEVTGRSRYIAYSSIYVSEYAGIDYETYEYIYNNYFDGENQVTSALNYVASTSLPVMYQLSGHGDATLSTSLHNALENDNVSLADLNLLSEGSVPEDCACLLILNPSSDLSTAETEMILSYLQDGGKMLIVTDAENYNADSYKNIASVLAYYGVTTVDGMVIEGDSQYYYMANSYLLPEINSAHEITSPLAGQYYVFFPYTQGIYVGESRDDVSVENLLETTDESYSKLAGWEMEIYEKEDGDIDGPFALGVAITETVGENAEELALATDTDASAIEVPLEDETRIVYFTGAYFLEDSIDEMVSGANHDLFLNSVGWLCDREETISIRAKTITDEYLTISSFSATMWELLLIGMVPLGVILTGIVICMKRSRRGKRFGMEKKI